MSYSDFDAVAGYSGTPLAKKLGIGPGVRVGIVDDPGGFQRWLSNSGVNCVMAGESESVDVTVVFVTLRSTLVSLLENEIAMLAERGGIWIAWPKKAAKVPTDITEDTLRDIILPTGLVDNKVCAINATWSGLRFVRRLKQ